MGGGVVVQRIAQLERTGMFCKLPRDMLDQFNFSHSSVNFMSV